MPLCWLLVAREPCHRALCRCSQVVLGCPHCHIPHLHSAVSHIAYSLPDRRAESASRTNTGWKMRAEREAEQAGSGIRCCALPCVKTTSQSFTRCLCCALFGVYESVNVVLDECLVAASTRLCVRCHDRTKHCSNSWHKRLIGCRKCNSAQDQGWVSMS
jgi:hypothetical protein